MKQIKYFSLPIIVLLLSLSHQSCIEDVDLHLNSDSETYVIDAMLVHPDTIHYVKITRTNGVPIDTLTKFSIKLIDDKGRFDLRPADLITYSPGEYFTLGEKIGKFGYSVSKKKTAKRKK